jgi:formamidopyrimidine-DNA glycosylase
MTEKLRKPIPDTKDLNFAMGRDIRAFRRIGKTIFFDVGQPKHISFHLGMTGSFFLVESGKAFENKHLRLVIGLKSGRKLAFVDPRKFGLIQVCALPEEKVLEPLDKDLTGSFIRGLCKGRRASVKSIIMDQSRLSGLGNIYANEALFKSGINPQTPVLALNRAECDLLAGNIALVISAAIKRGQESFEQRGLLDSETTHFPIETQVYARAGEACLKCRLYEVERILIAGRSSFFCRNCQPLRS